ncbi:MAG: response regulator transcription factor [Lachnospiraceae bacterium]|nr:response regulator transcription factor [Lachnospiraceae bacterium]MCI9150498.1 response regulator transcription factor [Lachnospiraceae bacterium]
MKILLLEDDFALCSAIQSELTKNGYMVDACNDGETAMLYALHTDYSYDLAIVDRMLPIIDGLTIIKAMRKKNIQIPVIIITGMTALSERIEGLDGGADDYLVKPFHMQELLARVRALTRRPVQIKAADALQYADLHFDKSNRELTCSLRTVFLTAKESELMYVLLKSPDTLFSREQLILKIWGTSSEVEPGNVDNYISFLRKRLRELKSVCEIKTVYGAGYSLTHK